MTYRKKFLKKNGAVLARLSIRVFQVISHRKNFRENMKFIFIYSSCSGWVTKLKIIFRHFSCSFYSWGFSSKISRPYYFRYTPALYPQQDTSYLPFNRYYHHELALKRPLLFCAAAIQFEIISLFGWNSASATFIWSSLPF